jgi:hypothetical protein
MNGQPQPRPYRLAALSALLLFSLLSVRCQKTSNDPAPETAAVVGSWKMTAQTTSPPLPVYGEIYGNDLYKFFVGVGRTCFTDIVYKFNADGTATATVPQGCPIDGDDVRDYVGFDLQSKWSLAGNTLSVTSSDGDRVDYAMTTDGGTMKLVYAKKDLNSPQEYTYTITLAKQ